MNRALKMAGNLSVGAILLLGGCAGTGPRRIQPGSPEAVTSMGVDLADFKNAAAQMVEQLLVHPAIANFPGENAGQLPVIGVGSITNVSGLNMDMGQIAGRINEDLLNSGRVKLRAADAGAADENAKRDWVNDRKTSSKAVVNYLLEGRIMHLAASQGKKQERTYTFQLRLNDPNDQSTVWQRTVDVSKQGGTGSSW